MSRLWSKKWIWIPGLLLLSYLLTAKHFHRVELCIPWYKKKNWSEIPFTHLTNLKTILWVCYIIYSKGCATGHPADSSVLAVKLCTFCSYSSKIHLRNQRCTAHDGRQSLTEGSRFGKPDITDCYIKDRLDSTMVVPATSSAKIVWNRN